MLIPSSVSFRYCDILRGIISNILLKKTGNFMMYASPNVVQNRNEHNLINDFKSEIEMYLHNETILSFIENGIESIDGDYTQLKKLMKCIYNNLLHNKVITQLDIEILDKWLEYF
jgi:Leucine-rich repeat (LRR) protein